MSERSRRRLVVLQVLVLSLLLTLLGRLWFLQVGSSGGYARAAVTQHVRELVTPAPRGLVLDARGRTLATNRTSLVVSVSRAQLLREHDGGRALLARVAAVVRKPVARVWAATRLCGEPDAAPGTCWNGSPLEPTPVSRDTDQRAALAIGERSEDFPGVTAQLVAVRTYPEPLGALAPHEIGYLGVATQQELDAATAGRPLAAGDVVGRAGVEKSYDYVLRGTPGVQRLSVDRTGAVTGTAGGSDPVAGDNLVTTLDAGVQAVAERQLQAAITRARTTGDPNKHGRRFAADSGAVVVMDVRTGGIVAMASYPTYDPNVWVGGISQKDYAAVAGARTNYPDLSRAFQGEYAPGSTFKVVTLPAAVQSGHYPLGGRYDCPSSYSVGGTAKRNYESEAYGPISLTRALQVSCDTIFYRFAYEQWRRDGGLQAKPDPADPMLRMARAFHLGRLTGLDLPGERAGRIPDRAWKKAYWEATKASSCSLAAAGYPQLAGDPVRRAYLTRVARESCTDGYAYRGGDAANFAIGQGDTLVTPLQMAMVYSAVANGGTLWQPHVGKAVLTPAGHVVNTVRPTALGRLPVTGAVMAFLHAALPSVSTLGTGRGAFAAAYFPLGAIPVASKTGTAEVYGRQSTSWFASYAPANAPRFAVVMMVSQGGTGSGIAGPSVAAIYRALFGVGARGVVQPQTALLLGAAPSAALPRVAPDGTVTEPAGTPYARRHVAPPG